MIMDDFDTDGLDSLLHNLKTRRERNKSFELDYEGVADTAGETSGEWSEWMCPHCGIFMKDTRTRCVSCHTPRF